MENNLTLHYNLDGPAFLSLANFSTMKINKLERESRRFENLISEYTKYIH